MKLNFLTTLAFATGISLTANAQNLKVQPEFWYSGFEDNSLQLLVYGDNIGRYKATINAANTTLVSEERVANGNYLFLNFKVGKPEKFEILLQDSTSKKRKTTIAYEIKERTKRSRGFSDKDLLYMLMPDRFANGDPNNDNMPGMLEQANNSNPDGRHGGDIKGISDHVDYLKKLGVTGVWINPLLENNMPAYSYHGYAITDFYKVDARYGTNAEYKALADRLHENGIKLIMDMIFNHCGSNNFLFKDLPDSTWVHQWPEFTRSNYRGTVCFDPHASESDKKQMLDGWFDSTMPDFNQANPYLLKYLIQNSIWWVEYLGLDANRMDTYPYNDKMAMRVWCDALHREYRDISLLGEVWLNENPFTTYFCNDVRNLDGFTSGLDHVTDFPLTFALNKAFNEPEAWETGMARIYQHFVSDYLLPHPEKNLVFIDNHDLNRVMTDMHGDVDKVKMIFTIILTTRGIPCMYYGSEVLMESPKDGDGWKRQNMYGGWQGDTKNAFTGNGLTAKEKDMFNFISTLANFRKSSNAFSGKMIHFLPQDGVYVYFRINGGEKVMVVINSSDKEKTLDLSRFAECLGGVKTMKNILANDAAVQLPASIKVAKKTPQVWKLN
ncbi:MAG: glycoside hydrolase family 13 protein [Bacteroidales bacterium]|nr:glycoside hydrolase family 13 protein [Bacteroidales bacterium]